MLSMDVSLLADSEFDGHPTTAKCDKDMAGAVVTTCLRYLVLVGWWAWWAYNTMRIKLPSLWVQSFRILDSQQSSQDFCWGWRHPRPTSQSSVRNQSTALFSVSGRQAICLEATREILCGAVHPHIVPTARSTEIWCAWEFGNPWNSLP